MKPAEQLHITLFGIPLWLDHFVVYNWMTHWKMGIHLIFRTKRFGVDNRWWSEFDSIFGWSWKKRVMACVKVTPLISNWQMMWFRATACHFLNDEDKVAFGFKPVESMRC